VCVLVGVASGVCDGVIVLVWVGVTNLLKTKLLT